MRNPPIRGPFEKFEKKFLFQKSKCTQVSSINLKGKVDDTKNIVTFVTIHMRHCVPIYGRDSLGGISIFKTFLFYSTHRYFVTTTNAMAWNVSKYKD